VIVRSLSLAFVALLLGRWAAPPAPAPMLINESRSLPRGLYLRTADPVDAGEIVALSPPAEAWPYLRGLGAGPKARLLKRVAATRGEMVCARDGNLRWPRGAVAALARDRHGATLPQWRGCRRLEWDELLVVGDTPASFDSRYFGPVRSAAVLGVYKEVLRW
jgi:conjugative transfer signal peptidase TraF